MRTIRLKGKHIIYTIVFTVAALLIVYLAVGPPLLMHYAEKLAGSGRVKDAQAVYDRVAELFHSSAAQSPCTIRRDTTHRPITGWVPVLRRPELCISSRTFHPPSTESS